MALDPRMFTRAICELALIAFLPVVGVLVGVLRFLLVG